MVFPVSGEVLRVSSCYMRVRQPFPFSEVGLDVGIGLRMYLLLCTSMYSVILCGLRKELSMHSLSNCDITRLLIDNQFYLMAILFLD